MLLTLSVVVFESWVGAGGRGCSDFLTKLKLILSLPYIASPLGCLSALHALHSQFLTLNIELIKKEPSFEHLYIHHTPCSQ